MNTLKNKVNLIGRLGSKPTETAFESGSKLVKVSLATNESYKDKKGEWVENTQWHNIVAWGKQGERMLKALDKGTEVVIEGRLINKTYETKTGDKRFSTEIELNDFIVLGSKPVQ